MISKQKLPTTRPKKRQVSTAVSFFKRPRESIFLVHISLRLLIDHDTSLPRRRSCQDLSANNDPKREHLWIEQYAQNLERLGNRRDSN